MKKADITKTGPADAVYSGIKRILEEARSTAYRAVNFAMVQAYWNIGRVVVEEEQKGKTKADYGEYLIKELAKCLTVEFGKGFTETNLRYMRLFYLLFEIGNAESSLFPLKGIHHAVRDELPVVRPDLSWTHYRLLLKVENEKARTFYLNEAAETRWSTRQLERQIRGENKLM